MVEDITVKIEEVEEEVGIIKVMMTGIPGQVIDSEGDSSLAMNDYIC